MSRRSRHRETSSTRFEPSTRGSPATPRASSTFIVVPPTPPRDSDTTPLRSPHSLPRRRLLLRASQTLFAWPAPTGATVVDIGCGAGMDLLLAASAVGPGGRAIGIDMTEPMAERARASARALGLAHVEVRAGDALDVPVDSESVDFVISNGVLNLAPDKRQAFGEVFRILKPGGQFLYADIVVASELSESIRRDIDLWTG